MSALASLEAFAESRGVTSDPTDVHALRTLEIVSTFIRMRTGQRLDVVEGDVQELAGNWSEVLWLPQIPVHVGEEDEVLVSTRLPGETSYTDLAAGSFSASRDGQLLLLSGGSGCHWGGPRTRVRVTYSHGYETGHPRLDDIENCVCAIGARTLANPTQAQSKSLGSFQVTFADVSAAGLTELEADLIRRLENPRA